MDPTEAVMRRARELRERAARLDRRTKELVERSSDLLEQIDRHVGPKTPDKPTPTRLDLVDPYPHEPRRAPDEAGR